MKRMEREIMMLLLGVATGLFMSVVSGLFIGSVMLVNSIEIDENEVDRTWEVREI